MEHGIELKADWQELHCTARKDQIDALEEWFFAAGALSVTLEDPSRSTAA